MDWQTLAWEPLGGPLLAAAAPVAEFAEILQGAVEESASALAQAPIRVADASIAPVAAFASVALDVEPVATFELMASARRVVAVAIDPAVGTTLAGAGVVPVILARAIAEGVDGAFADLLGEGLKIGAADAATIPGPAAAVALRLRLRGPDGTGVDLVVVVDEAVPAELAAHVVALRALGAADLPHIPPAAADGADGASRDGPQALGGATFTGAQASAFAAPSPRAPAPASAASAAELAHVPGRDAPAGPAIRPATFDELSPRTPDRPTTSLDLLLGVNLQVTVEIGRTKLQIRDILGLAPGSIVELDKLAGEPVDVLVNGRQIATGEVVVVDENFGVRITEIVSRQRRIAAGAAPAA
jgi:flagellar motor switch protein FliN